MSAVEQYYNERAPKEWQRLEHHRTEFAVTLRALAEFLPVPPTTILDMGGGPGRYSIALAQQGYNVTLADLSPENLILARQKAAEAHIQLHNIVQANASDLSLFGAEAYDAVLLLGPLYHLLSKTDREHAVREVLRVLKPGGTLFAAFVTPFAVLRWMAKHDPSELINRRADVEQILVTGVDDTGIGFSPAYFAHPAEIKPLMEGCGLETVQIIGCEGVVAQIEEQINQLEGEAWEAWVDLNYRSGKDPALHGAADHVLYVGRKGD